MLCPRPTPSLHGVLIACGLAMTTAVALAPLPVLAQDAARTTLDWRGTYSGTLPCAGCAGTETKLMLGADDSYELTETQIGRGAPLLTKGKFTREPDGALIRLVGTPNNRLVLIGDGFVELLDDSKKSGNRDYQLKKRQRVEIAGGKKPNVFTAGTQTLKLDPRSIVATQAGGVKRVRAKAVWNFARRIAETGHRSMRVSLGVNCTQKTYKMPLISYFSGANARGKLVKKLRQPTVEARPLPTGDDVIAKFAAAYCTP